MAALLGEAERRPDRLAQSQVQLARGNSTRTLLVRIAAEHDDGEISGFVVTFDDITELLSAQRKAAWADIARRIAHEIKNPLTPIQLSAERLRRKYLKEIKQDPETFTICTDTIIRHVGDIGRMVDEFSSFARMPAPVLEAGESGRDRRIARCSCSAPRTARSRSRRAFRTARSRSAAMLAWSARRWSTSSRTRSKRSRRESPSTAAAPPDRSACR